VPAFNDSICLTPFEHTARINQNKNGKIKERRADWSD